MPSITLYNNLDLKSVLAVGHAREVAIRTNEGLVDGEHLLYGISVLDLSRVAPAVDSLMAEAGLTEAAILDIIGPVGEVSVDAHGRFAPLVERVMEIASESAGGAEITVVHILRATLDQARLNVKSGVAELIAQITPHLDLDQMIQAIDNDMASKAGR